MPSGGSVRLRPRFSVQWPSRSISARRAANHPVAPQRLLLGLGQPRQACRPNGGIDDLFASSHSSIPAKVTPLCILVSLNPKYHEKSFRVLIYVNNRPSLTLQCRFHPIR